MKATTSRLGAGTVSIAVAACLLGAAALVLWLGSTPTHGPADHTVALPSTPPVAAAGPSTHPNAPTPISPDPAPARAAPSKVIVYYFHRTVRCHACLAIEDLAWRAIEARYIDALTEGALEWRPLNLDDAENAHFEKDFDLSAQSLVLARVEKGKATEWKVLTEVWKLYDDPAEFERYVHDEVTAYLK